MGTKQKKSRKSATPKKQQVQVFVDGAGCRPGGDGSGFAWIRPATGEKYIEPVRGLTNNEAEYRGLISALKSLPKGSAAVIFSDSQLMCFQYTGEYKVADPKLQRLLAEARQIVMENRLTITVVWIHRRDNLAGKLL